MYGHAFFKKCGWESEKHKLELRREGGLSGRSLVSFDVAELTVCALTPDAQGKPAQISWSQIGRTLFLKPGLGWVCWLDQSWIQVGLGVDLSHCRPGWNASIPAESKGRKKGQSALHRNAQGVPEGVCAPSSWAGRCPSSLLNGISRAVDGPWSESPGAVASRSTCCFGRNRQVSLHPLGPRPQVLMPTGLSRHLKCLSLWMWSFLLSRPELREGDER